MQKTIIFFLFVYLLGFSNEIKSSEIQKKDPFFAGVLSWYIPGAGQFYGNNIKRGIFFLTGQILISGSLLVIGENYEYKIGYGGTIKFVPQKSKTEKEKDIFYLTLFQITFRIISVVDAIKTVKDYNDMLEKPALSLHFENEKIYLVKKTTF